MLRLLSRFTRVLVGLGSLALAVAIFALLVRTKPAPTMHELHETALAVRGVPAQTVSLPQRFTSYGTARPMEASDVAAEIGGRVIERPETVEAGAPIREGDIILRIDPEDFASRVESLTQSISSIRAQLTGLEVEQSSLASQVELLGEDVRVAERELDRAREARSKGAGTESDIDLRTQTLSRSRQTLEALKQQLDLIPSRRSALEAQYASSKADLKVAERDLDRSTIKSPVSGVLRSVEAERGEWLRAGDPVARVVDLRVIEIPLRVPSGAIGTIELGDRVEIRRDDNTSQSWEGTVSRISPEADPMTRTTEVYVVVDQSDAIGEDGKPVSRESLLLPGQFVTATITTTVQKPRLVVPRRVVDIDRVLIGIPTENEDVEPSDAEGRLMRVREVEVSVLRYDSGELGHVVPGETQWAVLGTQGVTPSRALHEGQWVLLSNLEQLRPGMLVSVIDVLDAPAEGPTAGTTEEPSSTGGASR